MIERIVSGGQTGADQAGLRAAKAAGISTGGWAPRWWKTEDGAAPWLAKFGLIECLEPGYPARTRRNASGSDGTIFFGSSGSGYRATRWACEECGKPLLWIEAPDIGPVPGYAAGWITSRDIRVMNVAGNRASKWPGIGAWVEGYLAEVFRLILLRPSRPIPPPRIPR